MRKQPFNGIFDKLTPLQRQKLINRVLAWWHNYGRHRKAKRLGTNEAQATQINTIFS